MHEVGIISSLVKTIEKMVQEEGMTEVQRVVLEVGELSGIVPEYMEKCWPAATYRTFMEKTTLEMHVVPGIVKCRDCGCFLMRLAMIWYVLYVNLRIWRSCREMT